MSLGSSSRLLQNRKSKEDNAVHAVKPAGKLTTDLHFIMTRSSRSDNLPMSRGNDCSPMHFSRESSTRFVQLTMESGSCLIPLHSFSESTFRLFKRPTESGMLFKHLHLSRRSSSSLSSPPRESGSDVSVLFAIPDEPPSRSFFKLIVQTGIEYRAAYESLRSCCGFANNNYEKYTHLFNPEMLSGSSAIR